MKVPPLFVALKIRHGNLRIPSIWLPVFLLWPLFGFLGFLIFFFGFFAGVILDQRSIPRVIAFFSGLYFAVCELRGASVDFEDQNNHVVVTIS